MSDIAWFDSITYNSVARTNGGPMSSRSCLTLSTLLLTVVFANGQTASDLSLKYPAISAYKVRPGILMTAKYAEDGQVCEMILQRRYMPDQTDADSTISPKVEKKLIDELAPGAERGPESKWLGQDSFVAGGVTHIEKDFQN